MTLRGFRALQDHWLMREREKYARSYQIINYITAAFGRTSELNPGDVFPILADIVKQAEESDDDIDPRESFQMAKHAMSKSIG
jgi:hypothetical protein